MAISRSWHQEAHRSQRGGWLRATVLGANDGILSTSALVVGVAAAGQGLTEVVIAGIAGVVAGALSMAAGEYVSVSSQKDAEDADLTLEASELETHPDEELHELTRIYEDRGLDPDLAHQVAAALTESDALGTHARDEIGLDDMRRARPLQAAGASALAFISGAVIPLIAVAASGELRIPATVVVTILALGALGWAGAIAGGAPPRRAAARVVAWGVVAMAISVSIGVVIDSAI
jgi:VIT1/CCC1 family predicted Fe2+/Mn2+ transporter